MRKSKQFITKTKQNKVQYKLDTQTVNTSVYHVRMSINMEDVLPEKDLLKKVATIKRFENLPLGKVLKKQPDIAKDNIKDYTRSMN